MAYQQQHYDHYPQQRQQQQQQQQNYAQPQRRQQQQQYQGYDDHYQQQNHDYGYDQGAYEQYDDGYYDQHGRWIQTAQHGGHENMNGYQRQPQQGQRPPPQPQRQYPQEQAYDNYNQQRQAPQNDPRSRPQGRGNGPQPGPQQGRGGLRPPGMDRSMLQPISPKTLPQDNPFPTFPSKKEPGPPARDNIEQGMARMNINDGGNSQQKVRASPPRGQPVPQGNRGPPQPRPDFNGRQDSGHFDGQGPNQRMPPNNMQQGQRPPQLQTDGSRGPAQRRPSEPQSSSQRGFHPAMQRSATMPQNLPSASHAQGYGNQQQWVEPGAAPGYHDVSSPTYSAPRPSTAGGSRQQASQSHANQKPPMPQQQQQQQLRQHPQQQHQQQHNEIDDFYDDYYGESNERKSMASSIDMPNFDAMPNNGNGHRRGDSIDNHLGPSTQGGTSHGFTQDANIPEAAQPQSNFQQQALRSRSQGDLHGQYAQNAYDNAPPVPMLPRANTGFEGNNGLPSNPRGRGQPARGMTADPYQRQPSDPTYAQGVGQNFDPRYNQPPAQIQRGYSGDSAYSEPPMNTMRNVASPMGPGNPIRRPGTAQPMQRPGTAGPGPGRTPSDPLGQRPGTTQSRMNPDALPSHPAPVRAGLMQQGQQPQMQGAPQPVERSAPVRQYNNDNGRASMESQQSAVRRQSAPPHPVTHDELNRLRNTWRANPNDNASALLLAKKLVEAASVLADEGGTADSRTRNKNREKFILEGHKIIKKLASAGYGDAMFYLADCYGQGLLGLQVDTKEAFLLYQSGAKAGHAASAYRTAVCCEMGHEEGGGTKRDPMKAVQWYRRAASLGDTPALYKMGMILLKGLLGQQKNVGEAINMLKRAAERADKDNPHALHELALIYEANTGNERIIQDEAYSLQLFHQAADLGYKFSQFRLGQAYEYGLLGCPIDARTSIAWYTRAAAQEEHQSELALSGWYLTGTSGILEQSDTEAYLWARKAACAEPPLPKALFAMGYFTEVGIGCPRSLDEAKRWYARAASYKFPKAQERLEELKRGGSKAQMKRERLSRTNQKQQEENCTVM